MATKKSSGKHSKPLKPTSIFLEQARTLDDKTKSILKDKIQLTKENPYRNKRLKSDRHLFRIRLSGKKKEKRAIYEVTEEAILLLCILDRKKEYKDLRKYLRKIK